MELDPRALAEHPSNTNVRTEVGDVSDLVESIREIGIVQALTVTPDASFYRLLAGRRRTAAAIEAGLATVPCYVRPVVDKVDQQVPGVQIAENDRRATLTTADRARGFEQMRLAGLSQAKMAKATGHKPADVRRNLALAKSETAVAMAEHCDLTLDQALVLAEFEDDHEAVKALTATSKTQPDRWDHLVSRMRRDRDDAKKRRSLIDSYQAAHPGVSVLAAEDEIPAGAVELRRLIDDAGNQVDAGEHVACAGHAVVLDSYYSGQSSIATTPARTSVRCA